MKKRTIEIYAGEAKDNFVDPLIKYLPGPHSTDTLELIIDLSVFRSEVSMPFLMRNNPTPSPLKLKFYQALQTAIFQKVIVTEHVTAYSPRPQMNLLEYLPKDVEEVELPLHCVTECAADKVIILRCLEILLDYHKKIKSLTLTDVPPSPDFPASVVRFVRDDIPKLATVLYQSHVITEQII